MSKIKIICKQCGKEFLDYLSDHRQFCSIKCRISFPVSDSTKKKLKESLKKYYTLKKGTSDLIENNKRRIKIIKEKYSGENSNNWKGDDVGYSGKHYWLTKKFGKPSHCEFCGVEGKQNGRRWSIEWANKSGKYLRNILDYYKLCHKCHSVYDNNNPIVNIFKQLTKII